MSKKKKDLLPKFEMILLLVFLLTIIIWVIPKCGGGSKSSNRLPHTPGEVAQPDSMGLNAQNAAGRDTTRHLVTEVQPKFSEHTKLYVTIDGLNVRTKPGLNSSIIDRLPLGEEVFFLDDVSDSTQQINLGDRIANEPWIKIKTPKGRTGWVYGAGVNYYKKKVKVVSKPAEE